MDSNETLHPETREPDWEFDERRWLLCKLLLQKGEELVWYEQDARFSPTVEVRKTLRRNRDDITFLVEDPKTNKVLTVGTVGHFKPDLSSELLSSCMKLVQNAQNLQRGCDCEYDYRCTNCSRILGIITEFSLIAQAVTDQASLTHLGQTLATIKQGLR